MAGHVVRDARAALPRDGDVFDLRSRSLAGAARLAGDARTDEALKRLVAELERREAGATPADREIPPRLRNVRASRDEGAAAG